MNFKEIDLKEYLKVIYRNRRIFWLTLIAIFIFTLIITISTPKIYEARTNVIFAGSGDLSQFASFGGISLPIPYLSKNKDSGGGGGGGGGTSFLSPSFSKLGSGGYIRVLLNSRRIRLSLAKKIDLYKWYNVQSDEQVLQILNSNTIVFFDKEGILSVTVRDRDPDKAALIANTFIDMVKEYTDTSKVSLTKKRRIFLEKQLEAGKKELDDLNNKMREFTEKYKIFNLDAHTEAIERDKSGLNKQKMDNNTKIDQISKSLEKIKKELISQLNMSKSDFTQVNATKDSILNSIRSDLINKKLNLMFARKGRSENHPTVVKLKIEISALEDAYRQQLEKYIKNLNSNYSAEFVELQTQYLIALAESEALNLAQKRLDKYLESQPKIIMDYMELERKFENKKLACALFEQDLENTRIAEIQEVPDLEVLDQAVKPEAPCSPNRKKNLMIGLLFGVVFGFVAAISWEYIDKNVVQNIIKSSPRLQGQRPLRRGE